MTSAAIRVLNARHALQSLGRAKRPRFFVNSIPKTGTNLVVSLARAYGRLALSGPLIAARADVGIFAGRGGLVFGHVESLPGGFAAAGFDDTFLLVRRPEGYVMSLARYIEANRRHPLHRALGNTMRGAQADTLLRAIVEGVSLDGFALPAIDERYRQYVGGAQAWGLKLVDFDELRCGPPHKPNSAALMQAIGGANYAEAFVPMLAKSKRYSSTFKHSARSRLQGDLPEELRKAPAFEAAARIYDQSLSD